ncbi:kelch-like protein 10 isoform X1 [Pseudoliparis swirei]|uniref:kelch-like protein 10 isoform X1 n=3 Tax=Pseudoliparis swirei TaxID=2059687 RepID=UPI0024BDD039|nr:kelch-like protein 10 isoform X1 [Pseudoliparis swirei]
MRYESILEFLLLHIISMDSKHLSGPKRPVDLQETLVLQELEMSDQAEPSPRRSVFNDLRLEGQFCDAVINVENVAFDVHRVILCKCSEYFITLFGRCCPADTKVFVIPGVSPDAMRLIIEFAHTGSVSVTAENVRELLLAADRLNVMAVMQTCCDFLGERLRADNCIGTFQLTDIVFCPELQRRAYRYMVEHFEEVAHHEEFLQLPLQRLIDILERDDLNVRNESVAFEAVLRWIDHTPETRKAHVAVLFSKVRLALTSLNYMRLKVLSNELVSTSTECLSMAQSVLEAIGHIRTSRPSVAQLSNPLLRPRLPNAVLLAIGGWSGGDPTNGNATNGIEAYDFRADHWMNMTNNCERPRASHGTAVLNGSLYCIGGFDRAEFFNSVRRFDLSTRVWHEAAPMCHRRCFVSVTALDGCIYAMGGFDGHSWLCTAERYRPEANQWSLIAPMRERRSDASSTTLDNKLYICGGFNGTEYLQTAECYVPEADQWTMIASMFRLCSGTGTAAYGGLVYAVGGFDGNNCLNTAEAYDPVNNSWQEVTPMATPRSNFGIEVLDDRLFVVGGFNRNTTCCNVESYDETTAEWTEACDMGISRSGLSCCVVSGLPNMADYAVPRDALPLIHEDADSDEHS